MSLEALLTYREPLGPTDQANIRGDHESDTIINARVAPFSEALSRAPVLLLGRKGSGKSSILTEFRIRALHHGDRASSLEAPPSPGKPFLISIGSWDHFHQLTRHVASQFRASNPELDSELVPTEYLSTLWKEAIWDEIIKHFYNFCHHRESRPSLTSVERYIVADGRYSGPPEKEAQNLFDAAKTAVIEYAKVRGSNIVLLIDSMERYPVRNVIFSEVLSGLLQAVNAVHYDSELIHITFCLPEEIESHIRGSSANIMKDYNAAYRIRWKPIDLLKIVAHRFRLFVQLKDPEFYRSLSSVEIDTRDGVHALFRHILPQSIKNSMLESEDPLAYIIRHTQLLPRHAIAIFNGIVSRSFEKTGQFRSLDEDSIREGIGDAERLIAEQVLVPYYKIYPELIATCEDVLPDLAPVNTYNSLRRIERRFNKRVEEDVRSIWRTLFAMGVIGKVVPSDALDGGASRAARYCLAQFHYNIDGSFGLSGDDEYCFHPVFTRHFGITRKNGSDKRAIYPANVEIITIA